jgi:hypothetical protein
VAKGTAEPFFLHLFRGCILFESLLKHNPYVEPKGKTLGAILREDTIIDRLKTPKITGGNFDLNGVFNKLQSYQNSISEAIEITLMTRNTLGHTLGWNQIISQSQYQKLYFIIVSSCLHAIACLWK